ncbi:unnamed protein product, partial [Leptidea sinapis]
MTFGCCVAAPALLARSPAGGTTLPSLLCACSCWHPDWPALPHSEHAGVMMPLLRIFNEAGANISHMLIADTPISSRTFLDERSKADLEDVNTPNANYYWTILTAQIDKVSERVLVVAGGSRGGARGEARALLAWLVPPELALPPVHVAEPLAERVARRARERVDAVEMSEPPPEHAVRALCESPAHTLVLGAP